MIPIEFLDGKAKFLKLKKIVFLKKRGIYEEIYSGFHYNHNIDCDNYVNKQRLRCADLGRKCIKTQ